MKIGKVTIVLVDDSFTVRIKMCYGGEKQVFWRRYKISRSVKFIISIVSKR